MSQLMHQQALCALLETTINKVLALNVDDLGALLPLEQKTLTVQLAELAFPLSFSVDQQQILVTSLTERSDCQLTSSIASLIALQKEQQITELIKQDKLELSGDIKVAQQFSALFENLAIDWQSELAVHIGDIPTYKLSQFSLWLGDKVKFATKQISADASEWLVHEKRLVVTRSQINSFNRQVTTIDDEVQSLQARVERLADKLSATAKSPTSQI